MVDSNEAPAADQGPLKTYLGIALEQPEQLRQARTSVCAELGLLPRDEAHVTIAYLGRLDEVELAELSACLLPYLDDSLLRLPLVGVGAAYEPVLGAATLLRPDRRQDARPHACVAWWSVTPTPGLAALRHAATSLLAKIGRPVNAAEPFAPHITLGSRGREGIADADFDLYGVEKTTTLGGLACVDEARAARIHIAASQLLPASVVCLRAWY